MATTLPRKTLTTVLVLFIAIVFIQSLFFKFSDSPETRYIFGTLNAWGAGLGFPGLFAPSGIFSQYVVGTAELVASLVLLVGWVRKQSLLVALGAVLALGVISGAVFFHLFTPLGVQVLNTDGTLDGGQLFAMACGIWVSAAVLIATHREAWVRLIRAAGRGRALA
jgi:hypothetical protein